jgi:hypothetical protein
MNDRIASEKVNYTDTFIYFICIYMYPSITRLDAKLQCCKHLLFHKKFLDLTDI